MKPWLRIPPRIAHDIAPVAVRAYSWLFDDIQIPNWKPVKWRGLLFRNPLGLSGGVEKDGENIECWWKLGAGFVEIGTVTPLPQGPNPGKIIDRDVKEYALWNRMGFPSLGANEVLYNIKKMGPPYRTPLFLNIGKNRATPNEDAWKDYVKGIQVFSSHAQAFVINISSPNTVGLRDLCRSEYICPLLHHLKEELLSRNNQPLLLKLSPDMPETEFRKLIQDSLNEGVDGFILTNTTISRTPTCKFPKEGGVSGLPLKDLSRHALALLLDSLGQQRQGKLIVSVGGVTTSEEVFERLKLGADLVQVYTALIFEGPGFFHEISKEAKKLEIPQL